MKAVMKIKNLERLLFTGLYSLLVISAVGTMAGTYAWFTYTSRLTTQFHGTSLNNSAHLNVGVVSEVELSEASKYAFTQDETNNKIYWSKKGISKESLSYFLSASGYASEELSPVTSGAYEQNGAFSLKKRPSWLANSTSPAEKNFYIHLPLVFKAQDSKGNSYNSYDIRLSKVELDDQENGNLSKTIRINFLNQGTNENFLMNPSLIEDGYDTVGGALDFDTDGYFDNQGGKDFFYGEAETIVYETTPSLGGTPLPIEERTVFNAITREGCYAIDKEATVFKTSSYYGKETVVSKKDIASSDGDLLAYSTITIYQEGWSKSTTDRVIENIFDLDLTFELFNENNI